MFPCRPVVATVLFSSSILFAGTLGAQDWPQWRGASRDGKVTGFKAPASWPKELTEKWKVEIGDGVATPSLLGGKLFVFARQEGNEVIRCLDASSGKELWQDRYPSDGAPGPARGFSGPRASPAVADGKVVTLGVQGILSCYDAKAGKRLWRNDASAGSIPRFANSSSPIIVGGLCIAQLGSERSGGVMAFDLESGKEKWKWTNDGPCYGSPALASIGGTSVIIAPNASSIVALDTSGGQELWRTDWRQGRYNAASPMVDGQTLIYAGPERGMTALKLVKKGEKLAAEDLWKNPDSSLMFNTPIVRSGLVFGLSGQNDLFCINTRDGKTAWDAPFEATASGGGGRGRSENVAGGGQQAGGQERRRGRPGGFGGRRGGGGRGGYGSVVDADSVLFALTPSGTLTVFEPSREKLNRLASYKVAGGMTYAYPVISGKHIYIKDANSVTLWAIE